MPASIRMTLALASVWFLCGLKAPTMHLRTPQQMPVVVYQFVDARNPKLAKSGNESLMIANCAYGAVRFGQRDIEPDLSVLLHEMLASRFGDRLAAHRVELTAFSLHINNAASLRASTAQMFTGVIPHLMNDTRKVGCSGDDTRGGYLLSEMPTGGSPLVVAVHILIDGKPYRGRAISSKLLAPVPATSEQPPTTEAPPAAPMHQSPFQILVDTALTRLGDAVEADFPAPADLAAPIVENQTPAFVPAPKDP